jgi:hypothetical protein
MKRLSGIATVLVLLAAPMFAANNKPKTVVIPENVQVGTTKIPAGSYKLAWTTGTGQEVQATLTQGGKTVATFAAKTVTTKNNNPGVGIDTNAGGAQLTEILLENLRLQVESEPQPTAAGGGSL